MIGMSVIFPGGETKLFVASNRATVARRVSNWLGRREPAAGYGFYWFTTWGEKGRCETAPAGPNQWRLTGMPSTMVDRVHSWAHTATRFGFFGVKFSGVDVGPGFWISEPAGGEAAVSKFVEGLEAGYYKVVGPPRYRQNRFVVWGKELSASQELGTVENLPGDTHYVRSDPGLPVLTLPGRSLVAKEVTAL